MYVLGIETSCDETAAAVVDGEGRLLSAVLSSQVEIHSAYGGVVPELASRNHILKILPVIDSAVRQAALSLGQIGAIAVTNGPGLIGSLLVGLQVAKALAATLRVPLVGINHLEGHLMAAFLSADKPPFPHVGLLASGGHTSLFLVQGFGCYSLLGNTRDDAAGEAFDKAAKMLGLPYPGGIYIEQLASKGNPKAFRFPRALGGRRTLDFSFSGLKTCLRRFIQQQGPISEVLMADIASSFQEAIIDPLCRKAIYAAERCGCGSIVLAGGVAANQRLREVMAASTAREGMALFCPPMEFCTDNAAMIALAAIPRLALGQNDGMDIAAFANLRIQSFG